MQGRSQVAGTLACRDDDRDVGHRGSASDARRRGPGASDGGGDAGRDRIWRQVGGDDRAGTHLHPAPDSHTGQDDRADADVGVILDDDWCEFDPAVKDGCLDAVLGMDRRDDANAGTDPHIPSDRDPTGRVEIALLPDPAPVADHERVHVITLEDRQVADVHVGPDLDVVGSKDEDVILDDRATAQSRKIGRLPSAGAVRRAGRAPGAGHRPATRRSTTVACSSGVMLAWRGRVKARAATASVVGKSPGRNP